MILSHEHRFIFLKTRKTAGTSIELALSQICGEKDILTRVSPRDEAMRETLPGPNAQNWLAPGMRINRPERLLGRLLGQHTRGRGYFNHVPAREVLRLAGPRIWRSYFKISVERNPWDRQVSLYYWRYPDADKRPTFDAFITSPRWRKKVDNFSIYSLAGRPAVDFVIRYEKLAEDVAEVFHRLGIQNPPELPATKSGTRTDRGDYRDHYTEKTRDIVAGWYRDEIAAFGYRF